MLKQLHIRLHKTANWKECIIMIWLWDK